LSTFIMFMSTFNFEKFFSDFFHELSDRECEVLKKRYQLTTDVAQKNTLKQIGDAYGITRERVRQIEREAINKLTKLASLEAYKAQLDEIESNLCQYLERKGGIATERELVGEHVEPNYQFDTLHLNAFLFLVESLIEPVVRVEEDDHFYAHWRLADLNHEHVASFVEQVVKHLDNEKKAADEAILFNVIKENVLANIKNSFLDEVLSKHSDLTNEDVIESYLTVTKKVEKNILGLWGLAEWPEIKPKKLSDKIHLIFAKSGKPLHFRDVAENINTSGFDRKNICAATVHNELIANDQYVLIGRGIYARKEWGFAPGTVADIIVDIIAKNGQPMSKEEIYEQVLKQRQVNPSTIYLSLINKDKFQKLSNGLFDVNARD